MQGSTSAKTDGWMEGGEGRKNGTVNWQHLFVDIIYFFQEKAGASNLAGGEKISVLILLKWTD